MLNTPNNEALILLATIARDTAARNLSAACKRVREHGNGPLADIYEMQMDEAFAALDVAQDALRLERDGYAHTYPHPVALAPHGRRYPVR